MAIGSCVMKVMCELGWVPIGVVRACQVQERMRSHSMHLFGGGLEATAREWRCGANIDE